MKKMISKLMALLLIIVAMTPFSVNASEDAVADAAFETETVVNEEATIADVDVVMEDVSEEQEEFALYSEEAEVNGGDDVLPGQIGAGFFSDSYNGLSLTGDDGKTTLVAGGNEIVLTQRLVANYGFIDRNQPNVIYVVYMNGKVYWYCYKYQGTAGKMNRLGNTAINGYNVTDGAVTSFQSASGKVSLLTDNQVREALGVDDNKDNSSSSSKPDDGKDNSSSTSKPDDGKDNSSSTSKPDDGKDNSSSTSKPDDGKDNDPSSDTIKVDNVVPAYGFVDVDCTINGQKITYRLVTGDYGEIQTAGITENGLVYILFKSGKLVLWHPSMLKDLNQTTVNAGELYVLSENCTGFKIVDGVVEFYDNTGNKIIIPTVEIIKNNPSAKINLYDYIVDNSVKSGDGYNTWTLLTRIDNKYYVVKHDKSNIELRFSWVSNKRIMFNGKKYKCSKASWSAGGDLFIKSGKRKVYVVRIVQKKDGSFKNKKMRFARRASDLHIDPITHLADYVVLRNGDKVDCVTGKKIN